MFFLKDNILNYKKIKNSNSDLFCVEAINIGYLLKSENERIAYFSGIHFY